jgi:hypothetical protein
VSRLYDDEEDLEASVEFDDPAARKADGDASDIDAADADGPDTDGPDVDERNERTDDEE